MPHDYRKDRITRGMMMTGGSFPAVSKDIAPLERFTEEREELEQRLQAVRDRIERFKAGDFS